MPPAVSILCPCRNERAHIATCVRSLLGQQAVVGGYEIVIIDGHSDDGTWEILQQLAASWPQLRLLRNPQRHVAAALNVGLAATRAAVLVRVDAHTEYAPNYVQRCVAALRATGADNVGGPARTRAHSAWQRAIAAAYHSPFSTGGALFHRIHYTGWVDTVTYGCWPRRTFERFGLFDEMLRRNQDDEHNLRICRGGGRIWQSADIVSWYTPRATLRQLFAQYYGYGYWKVRVLQKHRLPAAWRHLVPAASLLMAGVLSLTGLVAPRSHHVLAGGVGAYLLLLVAASVHACRGTSWRLLPMLPAVFATYHTSYGIGFLRGLWDVARPKGS